MIGGKQPKALKGREKRESIYKERDEHGEGTGRDWKFSGKRLMGEEGGS